MKIPTQIGEYFDYEDDLGFCQVFEYNNMLFLQQITCLGESKICLQKKSDIKKLKNTLEKYLEFIDERLNK